MNEDQRRGLRIRAVREALGLSQAELCRRLTIERNTWNQYERGARTPGWPEMTRFCDRTGASLDWIFRERLDSVRPTLVDNLANTFEAVVRAQQSVERDEASDAG